MQMAPFALNAKVDAMSLTDPESLSSAAFLPSVAKPTDNSTASASQAESECLGLKKEDKKVFRCTFPGCGREFQLKGNLKRHANIHNGDKKFACKFCGKRFLRKADMEVHYRVHTGEKPYRCKYEDCGKCFARRSDLLSHERTHTGRKPFACAFPNCDRSFARKFDLHKHQRLHEEQADASGKGKTKKRKLSPRISTSPPTKNDSGDESCDCPSDVTAPFAVSHTVADAALNADVLLPEPLAMKTPVPLASTCATGRRKMSATAACLDAPRPMRYELKCPENHIHSPPACFAALSSLDAFLLSQETLDLTRPLTLDAFPAHRPSTSVASSCCPAHLELRPPPPEDNAALTGSAIFNGSDGMMDQLFSAFPATSPPNSTTLVPKDASGSYPSMASDATSISGLQMMPANSALPNTASMDQTLAEPSLAFIAQDGNGSTLAPVSLLSSSATPFDGSAPNAQLSLPASAATPGNFGSAGSSSDFINMGSGVSAAAAGLNKSAAEKACLSTPASSLLDYSRHNRSCGHLSIQHGNHRDYVVQNHLLCQDSVTRLGALKRIPPNPKAVAKATATQPVKCSSPKDTHRPGCGHLPVRHKDHIDYVVEDNLICQQASWLEDDNLELLGDDFWDFYGAIDAFPTN
ncbi:Oocyte zinc finger protein XlCOF26 [Phytophthora ramorum]|uniref:Oocyte zinc finger protein XlCOF26 n=1 Tax=Phytophthora ramorum TaxID=164328 RepID=UPI0030B38B7A|nr:Oocyte zinc finger protein XlCOF26 [Phytophthora ramorum]